MGLATTGERTHTFHLSISSVSHGLSCLCVDGIFGVREVCDLGLVIYVRLLPDSPASAASGIALGRRSNRHKPGERAWEQTIRAEQQAIYHLLLTPPCHSFKMKAHGKRRSVVDPLLRLSYMYCTNTSYKRGARAVIERWTSHQL